MPTRTNPIDPQKGPLVTVIIGPCNAQTLIRAAGNIPNPRPVQITALLDTGAQTSLVDVGVLARVESHPMETVMVTSAYPGQERLCQIHEVNVRLLFEENESFNCGDIQVAEGHVERHGIRAILGRDVLSRLRFIYDGPGGTYTLEY